MYRKIKCFSFQSNCTELNFQLFFLAKDFIASSLRKRAQFLSEHNLCCLKFQSFDTVRPISQCNGTYSYEGTVLDIIMEENLGCGGKKVLPKTFLTLTENWAFSKSTFPMLYKNQSTFFSHLERYLKVQSSIKCVQFCRSNTLSLQCCPERSLWVFQYLLGQYCIWRIYWKQAGFIQVRHKSCLLYRAWEAKRC